MSDKTTNELLHVLSSVHSKNDLNNYIKTHTSPDSLFHFHTAFENLLKQYDKKKSDTIHKSTLDRTYAYQILNGTKRPSRDKILALCIAAGFSLKDTQQLLENMKEGILYSRSTRDTIIIYGIEHHLDVITINEMLFDMKENILA